MGFKTLKDIEKYDGPKGINREDVRKEAIKWVKELQKHYNSWTRQEVIDFVANRFNITEEDLK